MNINNNQIDRIKTRIRIAGIKQQSIQDELLDHYCNIIEYRMNNTQISFEQATQEAFELIDDDQLNIIQSEFNHIIHTQKRNKIMKLTFLFLAFSIIFNPFGNRKFDPPNKYPLSSKHVISSEYGMRMHPTLKRQKMHKGIDIKAPLGTPVLATGSGIIKVSKFHKKLGHYIIIKHDDIYETKYTHLKGRKVKEGNQIKSGDIIGTVGSTGLSMGPHLHYEVLKNGKNVNPKEYYQD